MNLALPCKDARKPRSCTSMRFNNDGNYCLTCKGDKLLKLWNPHRGVLLKTYSRHGHEVLDAVGSSDNSRLASSGGDKTVVQCDETTGWIMRRFKGHTSVSAHASITLSNRVQFHSKYTIVACQYWINTSSINKPLYLTRDNSYNLISWCRNRSIINVDRSCR